MSTKAKATKATKNTHLSLEDEQRFRRDFREIAKRTGQSPNPDRGDYDYRGAWKIGYRRAEDLTLGKGGKRHWPSEYKYVSASRWK
jgi:hypothetical protein